VINILVRTQGGHDCWKRDKLFPFSFDSSAPVNKASLLDSNKTITCSDHGLLYIASSAVAIDHVKPLATLFKDAAAFLMKEERRHIFYSGKFKLMCQRCNASKGSYHETYDALRATAVEIYNLLEAAGRQNLIANWPDIAADVYDLLMGYAQQEITDAQLLDELRKLKYRDTL
jgi:hypothetical protein